MLFPNLQLFAARGNRGEILINNKKSDIAEKSGEK
jgi:hypothetical protein